MQEIRLIRSQRKTISVEVRPDLEVLVRAPLKMKTADINKFIESKRAWIDKHLSSMRSKTVVRETAAAFTADEVKQMCQDALKLLPPRIEFWAERIGVSYSRITIRNQRTRWGSCTAKGHLSMNCLLALCPAEVVDYVIIHELCHLIHMNHSSAFWAEVAKYCPEWKTYRKWLKVSGQELIARL